MKHDSVVRETTVEVNERIRRFQSFAARTNPTNVWHGYT